MQQIENGIRKEINIGDAALGVGWMDGKRELKEEPTPPHRARCINECAYMRGKKNTRRHTSKNDNKKKGSELS
jgi:hypothetical protein